MKLSQSWCDVVRPEDGVEVMGEPDNPPPGGWQEVPRHVLQLFIEQVGDNEVPKGGYYVADDGVNKYPHTPQVEGVRGTERRGWGRAWARGATGAGDEVWGERVGEVVVVVWVACAAEVERALPTNWPSAAVRRAKSCA